MRQFLLALFVCFLCRTVVFAQWRADITGSEIVTLTGNDPGRRIVRITLRFTNGSQIVDGVPFEAVNPSTTSISDFCRSKIVQYEAMDVFISSAPIGVVDLTGRTVPPEEIARTKYFSDKVRLDFLQSLNLSGGLSADGLLDLAALRILVQNEYRSEYIGITP